VAAALIQAPTSRAKPLPPNSQRGTDRSGESSLPSPTDDINIDINGDIDNDRNDLLGNQSHCSASSLTFLLIATSAVRRLSVRARSETNPLHGTSQRTVASSIQAPDIIEQQFYLHWTIISGGFHLTDPDPVARAREVLGVHKRVKARPRLTIEHARESGYFATSLDSR
jgi:hypothetical protein